MEIYNGQKQIVFERQIVIKYIKKLQTELNQALYRKQGTQNEIKIKMLIYQSIESIDYTCKTTQNFKNLLDIL